MPIENSKSFSKPFVTYIDKDGNGIKQLFESDTEQHKYVDYDEHNNEYVYQDSGDRKYLLHSFEGNVAYFESKYGRQHHMYKGVLHRISGPAFETKSPGYNNEYYIFGLNISDHMNSPHEFLIRHKIYLERLEKYVYDNNILPDVFSEIPVLSSVGNLRYGAENNLFFTGLDGELIETTPKVIKEENNSGMMIGIAALGVATISALSLNKNTKKRNKLITNKKQNNFIENERKA